MESTENTVTNTENGNKPESDPAVGLSSLLCADGYIYFLIKIEPDVEYTMTFEVYEVTAWDMENNPIDKELYLTGTIKWDGCSHIWFGERDNNGHQDGYLHLCGKYYWQKHSDMMKALYELAERIIPNFNKDVAGT